MNDKRATDTTQQPTNGQQLMFDPGTPQKKRRPSRQAEELMTMREELHAVGERLNAVEELLGGLKELLESRHLQKEAYTTAEVAKLLGRRPYTVREWCRHERVNAYKVECGRGADEEWRITHEELLRIRNEGLLNSPYA